MKNIVLCGSMKVKDEILAVADQLKELGYEAQLPIECMEGQPKALASRAHMERVINPENHFILIVNAKKGRHRKLHRAKQLCGDCFWLLLPQKCFSA